MLLVLCMVAELVAKSLICRTFFSSSYSRPLSPASLARPSLSACLSIAMMRSSSARVAPAAKRVPRVPQGCRKGWAALADRLPQG